MTRRIMVPFVIFLAIVMVGTVVIALAQDAIGWGWWWVVPMAGGIILTIGVFRLLVQRAVERQEALDRELDANDVVGDGPESSSGRDWPGSSVAG